MDQATLWLSLLIMVVMTILIAPPILRLNQGKIVRNTAIWLGIVLALALFYRVFGPFDMATQSLPANASVQAADKERKGDRPQLDDGGETEEPRKPVDGGGYTPPNE